MRVLYHRFLTPSEGSTAVRLSRSQTEGSCPLQSGDQPNQLIDTMDTHVKATTFAPDLGVISDKLSDLDCAELPLDGVSPVVSRNPQ